MANKIVGVLFLLAAAGCGLLFFGPLFMHGYDEGVIRLRRLLEHPSGHLDLVIFGVGMLAFLVASVVLFMRKRPAG